MNHAVVKDLLCGIGLDVCKHVHQSLERQSIEELSAVYEESDEDTIYQIDRDVEDLVCPKLEARASELGGLVLVAEGIEDDGAPPVFPHGMCEGDAALRILMDPIDGTRGIMYDKRSAFFLAGAAPNRGAETGLQDIETAVMVELPTSRSHLSDTLWAVRGEGAKRFTYNLTTGLTTARPIVPSSAKTILGGFAQISRFFPPGRDWLARIDEETIAGIFPDPPPGRAILFEDQYISTGGQLYEILAGHDRFVADIRTALFRRMEQDGHKPGLTCHPYDVCAHLIGTEAGVAITNIDGGPLDAPFDTTASVDWIAYANPDIRAQVEPVLRQVLCKHGLTAGFRV